VPLPLPAGVRAERHWHFRAVLKAAATGGGFPHLTAP